MNFTKVTGYISRQNPEGRPGTIIRAVAIDANKMALVKEIIASYNGETRLTNKQVCVAMQNLRGIKYMPYWVEKNLAIKVKNTHLYDLSRFKLAAGEVEVTTEEQPQSATVTEPAPTKTTKKEKKSGKRENRKKKVEVPTVTTEDQPIQSDEPDHTFREGLEEVPAS